MSTFKILVVDDDPWYCKMLEYHLSMNPDNEVIKLSSAKECLNNLSKNPDLITLDYNLDESTGSEVLKKIKQYNNSLPVIIISNQADIYTAIHVLREGAYDYFIKDDNTVEFLKNAIIKIKELKELKTEIVHLREELAENYDLKNSIKGNSQAMQKVFTLIKKAASTNLNVSIFGETGTGKELVAKAIHYNSERRKKPLVAINMAAIPKELIESEMFGYEKGAFTGANIRKIGKFEEANNGTIFLDEIGDLDIAMQSKLLRVIQEREVVRIGGSNKISLDIRIIVATHKNIEAEVSLGKFREDFYYRIIGLPIVLPPLRERCDDILILAKYFLDNFCKNNSLKVLKLSNEAKNKLLSYNYPGNIRELKSIIELSAVMCNGTEIEPDDISFRITSSNNQFLGVEKTLKEYNIEIISSFLKKYENNIVKVAEKLQMGKSTIYKMINDGEILI